MPEPQEYRIVRSLQAALQGISTGAGYHHNAAATAVKLDANHEVEALLADETLRPFFILELEPDAFTLLPSDRCQVRMPATIHAVHDSDPTIDEDWIGTFYRLCADIEQAVALDHTRGGLAIDTRVGSREFRTYNGAQVWAMVKLEVSVKRTYGAPNG